MIKTLFNSWWHEAKTSGLQLFPGRGCELQACESAARKGTDKFTSVMYWATQSWRYLAADLREKWSKQPSRDGGGFFLSSLPLLFCKALIWNGKYRNFVSNFHQKAIYTTEFWNVYFLYCNKLYFWWTAVLSHVSAKHSQLVLHQSWKVHY